MTLKVIKLRELFNWDSVKNGSTLITSQHHKIVKVQNTVPKSSAACFYLNCSMFMSCRTAQPSTHCLLQNSTGDWGMRQLNLNLAWMEVVPEAILPPDLFYFLKQIPRKASGNILYSLQRADNIQQGCPQCSSSQLLYVCVCIFEARPGSNLPSSQKVMKKQQLQYNPT